MDTQACCLGHYRQRHRALLTRAFVCAGDLQGIWTETSDGERNHVTVIWINQLSGCCGGTDWCLTIPFNFLVWHRHKCVIDEGYWTPSSAKWSLGSCYGSLNWAGMNPLKALQWKIQDLTSRTRYLKLGEACTVSLTESPSWTPVLTQTSSVLGKGSDEKAIRTNGLVEGMFFKT